MQRKLLIDADVLVYESAFAAQKTVYTYQAKTFPSAKDAEAFCKEEGLDYRALRKAGEIGSRVEVLPLAVAIKSFGIKLNAILEACGSTNHSLLLSGDGNFREEVAVTRGYKANRSAPKPQHYLAVRGHVLGLPTCEQTIGVEADDAMGMYMSDDPSSVICSIDKDLNQIPGRHYDWGKKLFYKVAPNDGLYYFHRQLLTGDATDNIPGLPGMGEVKAVSLLEDVRDQPTQAWERVKQEYAKGPFTFKDGVVTHDDYLTEQMQLLWMMRRSGERVTPDYYQKEYLNDN